MQTVMQLNRVVGPGTPEWEARCAEDDAKAAAHIEARRAYMEAIPSLGALSIDFHSLTPPPPSPSGWRL